MEQSITEEQASEIESESARSCAISLSLSHGVRDGTGDTGAIKAELPPKRRVYQCKTCNREFSLFQALGGHRSSHHRLRSEDGTRIRTKAHRCSICGSQFSSGQALGGHMKRHRVNVGGRTRKSGLTKLNHGSVLLFDLNSTPSKEDA